MKTKGRRQSKNLVDRRSEKKPSFQSAAISSADSLGGNIKDAMRATPKMEKIGDKAGRSGMDEALKKDKAKVAGQKYGRLFTRNRTMQGKRRGS